MSQHSPANQRPLPYLVPTLDRYVADQRAQQAYILRDVQRRLDIQRQNDALREPSSKEKAE